MQAKEIMVVGCDALGSEVLKRLTLHGVGHLVIVDSDTVEAAAERLRAMNPDVEVTPICGDIAYDVGLGLIRRMDMVISCMDNRRARHAINRLCMRAGIPWVDGGIDDNFPLHEQWSPVTATPMTNDWRISEVLDWIKAERGRRNVCIQLVNDCFVDLVSARSNAAKVTVMQPGHRVAAAVERHPQLSGIPLSDLCQYEWREVDEAFPYQYLTLADIGIPPQDVLSVEVSGRQYYYELSAT